MQADHFDQQKLLALAAEDVVLAQLAHRRRTLPELAAVEGMTSFLEKRRPVWTD